MIQGRSILCVAPDPWDDIWRNRHQIMSRLAQRNRILYVEPRPYLRSVLAHPWTRVRGPRPRIRQVLPGLWAYRSPRYAPLSGREPLRTWTQRLREADLRRTLERLGMSRPILWLFRPDAADLVGCCDESLLVYHIVDDYLGYVDVQAGYDAARVADIRHREQYLMRQADVVLVTSKTLLETKRGINPFTYWVPNAVDYHPFARAVLDHQDPPELACVPHPRIGYVGALNDKVDTYLLAKIASAYPSASLVLVGPERAVAEETRAGLECLRRMPNVKLVGCVTVERVPQFVASCDVGVLPYRRNRWTEAIHPLKMYEYLACGLPVVATDIPSVRDESAVRAAKDAGDFIAAVGEALQDKDPNRRAMRQARAADNTWEHRVGRISEMIVAAIHRRESAVGEATP